MAKHTSRLKRKPTDPIQLTERDAVILKALHKYRFLTTDHLQALTGTKSRWGMNNRLRKLYDHKYIDRPKAQAAIFAYADKRPTVYALGNTGAALIASRYNFPMPPKVYWTEKNRRVREKHIEHTLGISDFMVSVEMECMGSDHLEMIDPQIIINRSPVQTQNSKYPFRWKTKIRHSGQPHDISIVPDYVFGIRDKNGPRYRNEKFYFVEIDRATMPVTRRDIKQTSYMRKIHSYADTYERGLAERRFGMNGFQMLTVTTSQKRIQDIQTAIANMKNFSFSAGTFLFKEKGNGQAHFPFHQGWTNAKGKPADMI